MEFGVGDQLGSNTLKKKLSIKVVVSNLNNLREIVVRMGAYKILINWKLIIRLRYWIVVE